MQVDVHGSVSMDVRDTSIIVPFGHITGSFICSGAPIKSLENSPRIVEGLFECSATCITSMVGAPLKVANVWCKLTRLESLEHCPQAAHGISITGTPLAFAMADNVLRVFKLKVRCEQFYAFDDNEINRIINKHWAERDILAAQEDLIDAGYGNVARL